MYELIVKHFLATVAGDFKFLVTKVIFSLEGEKFILTGTLNVVRANINSSNSLINSIFLLHLCKYQQKQLQYKESKF